MISVSQFSPSGDALMISYELPGDREKDQMFIPVRYGLWLQSTGRIYRLDDSLNKVSRNIVWEPSHFQEEGVIFYPADIYVDTNYSRSLGFEFPESMDDKKFDPWIWRPASNSFEPFPLEDVSRKRIVDMPGGMQRVLPSMSFGQFSESLDTKRFAKSSHDMLEIVDEANERILFSTGKAYKNWNLLALLFSIGFMAWGFVANTCFWRSEHEISERRCRYKSLAVLSGLVLMLDSVHIGFDMDYQNLYEANSQVLLAGLLAYLAWSLTFARDPIPTSPDGQTLPLSAFGYIRIHLLRRGQIFLGGCFVWMAASLAMMQLAKLETHLWLLLFPILTGLGLMLWGNLGVCKTMGR